MATVYVTGKYWKRERELVPFAHEFGLRVFQQNEASGDLELKELTPENQLPSDN